MTTEALTCPECGAPLDTHNPGVLQVQCAYCGNVVYWDAEGIQNAGKKSVLPEGFTRLYTGANGRYKGKAFHVLGRVRYSFGEGFWDEWYLELDSGDTAWLTEDDHELAFEQSFAGGAVPRQGELRPGDRFQIGDVQFAVEEVGRARCLGIEGALPKLVLPDETYAYLDASSVDGRYTLAIEYDDEPPTVFLGHWLEPDALTLDDEGEDW